MKQRVISALIISAIGVTAVVIGGVVLDVLLLAIATVCMNFMVHLQKKDIRLSKFMDWCILLFLH